MKIFSTFVTIGSFLAVASAAAVPTTTPATVASIMSDFTKISRLYTQTINAVAAFPQSGTQGATDIHDHETAIETLFGDINNNLATLPTPVPDKTAREIINKYQSFVPTIIESLNALTAKASDFEAMNAAPTIFLDLSVVRGTCAQFGGLITAMTPPDMTNDVNNMFDQLTAARDNASAALASVMSA